MLIICFLSIAFSLVRIGNVMNFDLHSVCICLFSCLYMVQIYHVKYNSRWIRSSHFETSFRHCNYSPLGYDFTLNNIQGHVDGMAWLRFPYDRHFNGESIANIEGTVKWDALTLMLRHRNAMGMYWDYCLSEAMSMIQIMGSCQARHWTRGWG